MRLHILTLALALTYAAPAAAQQANPQIDYQAFVELTVSLAETREARRLGLSEFNAKLESGEAILLDTRSASAFRQGHIRGAINLPFSDFTDQKLAKVLGADQSREILIYCNNNFTDNVTPVVSKRAPLALNIPTFINLHGYGYTNVWELADIMSTKDVAWVSAAPTNPDQTDAAP